MKPFYYIVYRERAVGYIYVYVEGHLNQRWISETLLSRHVPGGNEEHYEKPQSG
jgi:hypothetical protein